VPELQRFERPIRCPAALDAINVSSLGFSGTERRNHREDILRPSCHLGLWEQSVRVTPATGLPRSTVVEPSLDEPFPDYDVELVMAYANG